MKPLCEYGALSNKCCAYSVSMRRRPGSIYFMYVCKEHMDLLDKVAPKARN